MPKISLAAYSLLVSPFRNPQEKLPVDSFDGEHSLLEYADEYCGILQRQSQHLENLKSLIRLDTLLKNDRAGYIYGIVLRGEYGRAADLVNVNTGARSYARQLHDAELVPFYFLMEFRPGTERGIVLTQRLGHIGLRSDFLEGFSTSFSKKFPGFRTSLRSLVPDDLFRYYLQNGNIKTVEYTTFNVPNEIASFLGNGGYRESLGRVKTTLQPQAGLYFPIPDALKKFIDGGEMTTIAELKEEGIEELSIKVKVGRSTKTIDIGNPSNFRAYFDISDKVRSGDDGNPSLESIHAAALELLNDLRAEVNFTHASQSERLEHSN